MKGFSLVELMTALAVSSIGMVIVGGLLVMVFQQFHATRYKLETETAAARLEMLFRIYFEQAIDVGAGDAAFGDNGIPGRVADNFIFDQIGDIVGDWRVLGMFRREAGGREAITANTLSDIRATAIWFRKPSPTTSGVIFFGTDPGPALTPSYDQQWVDRVTYLEFSNKLVLNSGTAVGATVRSLDVRFRLRYHGKPHANNRWCPVLDITNGVAGCVPAAAVGGPQTYTDIERNFKIVFRNNLVKDPGAYGNMADLGEIRALGPIYFFSPILPSTMAF